MKAKLKILRLRLTEMKNKVTERFTGLTKKKKIIILAGIGAVMMIVSFCIWAKLLSSKQEATKDTITLGTYKGIPLTLEKSELTEGDIQEIAKSSINYYNKNNEKKEKLSLNTLTDAQVQEAFGMDSVNAFYDNIRKSQEATDQSNVHADAYEQICDYLLNTCTVNEFPNEMLTARVDEYLKNTQEDCAKYYDMTFTEYCQSMGMSETEYKESLTEYVKRTMSLELIFLAIADKEDIQYEENDFQSYMNELIANGGYQSEEAVYEQYGEEIVKTNYRMEAVTDWIIEHADITYVPAGTKTDNEAVSETK